MQEFTLTEGQQNGVDLFFELFKKKRHMTINGPAGTGKTFLMKHLIRELKKKGIRFAMCAPTHAAKIVLASTTGSQVSTIHSLLRIHPETYEDTYEFKQAGTPELNEIRLIVVDEGSQVDDDLFEILMTSIHRDCMVLAIGDKKQIQPVKHMPGHKSPFFSDPRFEQYHLTQIVRQAADNPIIQVATNIREGKWISPNFNRETKTGVIQAKSLAQIINFYLSKVNCPEDLLKYRFLAYTNRTVDEVNARIRAHVYGATDPFVVNEYLVMQGPVTEDYEYEGVDCTKTLLHNGQTVKIIDIKRTPVKISLPYVTSIELDAAEITVQKIESDITEVEDDEPVTFEVLWSEEAEQMKDDVLREAAMQYKQLPKGKSTKKCWDEFWELKNRFASTKSLGACTFHKSQGSTVDGVCLLTHKLDMCSVEEQEEMLYVGTTRARQWVVYL